jgi:hypothetical protein
MISPTVGLPGDPVGKRVPRSRTKRSGAAPHEGVCGIRSAASWRASWACEPAAGRSGAGQPPDRPTDRPTEGEVSIPSARPTRAPASRSRRRARSAQQTTACEAEKRRAVPTSSRIARSQRTDSVMARQRRADARVVAQFWSSGTTTAVDIQRENQRDNDTDRYVLAAQSRQVAGAAERKARAQSPSRIPAYPPAFSHRSPCPGSLDATAGPGQSLHGAVSCRAQRERRCRLLLLNERGAPQPSARGRGRCPLGRFGAVSEFAMSRRSLAGGSDTAVVANRRARAWPLPRHAGRSADSQVPGGGVRVGRPPRR